MVPLLREAWPDVEILVRADAGYAIPALYEFCEEHSLNYVIGYSTNNVLKAATRVTMNSVEAWAELHGESYQRFQNLPEYQADGWSRPRRIIAKCEVTSQSSCSERQGGPNRRFVITNLTQPAEHVYRQVYVKRGDAPERAIEELKHELGIDRLSSHQFFAGPRGTK